MSTSKNSNGWMWLVIAVLLATCIGLCVGYKVKSVKYVTGDSTLFNSAPVNIRETRKYPTAYMTIVSPDGPTCKYDSGMFAHAEQKWCREGHTGNQVLIVTNQEFIFMTFDELKKCGK